MISEIHPSVADMWDEFTNYNPEFKASPLPASRRFSDNENEANESAHLVLEKIKKATSTSLWRYQKHREELPASGTLHIVTNWNGVAKAVVRTTKVSLVPFNQIDEAHATMEGQGDGSLDHWKKTHWDLYTREMEPYGEIPAKDMMVVCEEFEIIWNNILQPI